MKCKAAPFAVCRLACGVALAVLPAECKWEMGIAHEYKTRHQAHGMRSQKINFQFEIAQYSLRTCLQSLLKETHSKFNA